MTLLNLSAHPLSQDPILGKLAQSIELTELQPNPSHLFALCNSIISQQLSVKASNTIINRVNEVVDLSAPQQILDCESDQLRAQGVSRPKLRYLRAVARHQLDNEQLWRCPEALPDSELLAELTSITGVGLWTAQLFLLFQLKRPNLFPARDLILQRAVGRLTKLPDHGRARERITERFAERWSPHRSVASRLLWKWESQRDPRKQ